LIRLTQMGRDGDKVDLKVEGALVLATLAVLDETLKTYRADGVKQVRLLTDGLVSVDRLELQSWHAGLPVRPRLLFCTSRQAVEALLESCAIAVFRYDNDEL
jgi:hypothetical protein